MTRPARAEALRRLSAELRHAHARVERTVAEAMEARHLLTEAEPERLRLYGAAALLETFYSGVEKALARIAQEMDGGLPQGSAWHRQLLEDMTLRIPELRPAVLRRETARALDGFLAFRHRFRNLYLFDLDAAPLRTLLDELPPCWTLTADDLRAFSDFLLALASSLTDADGR
jgi:hypothetical protein